MSIFDHIAKPKVSHSEDIILQIIKYNVVSYGIELILANTDIRYKFTVKFDRWNAFLSNVDCKDANSLLNKFIKCRKINYVNNTKEIYFYSFKPTTNGDLIDLNNYEFVHWFDIV
jgi:hypothetical protein